LCVFIGSVLSPIGTSEVLTQTQENAYALLQNLLDTDITMIHDVNSSISTSEQILASALPSKEKIQVIASIVIENFCEFENSPNIVIAALRTILLMTQQE
jgi:hypothetical protein